MIVDKRKPIWLNHALLVLSVLTPGLLLAHHSEITAEPLPKMGSAPGFTLTTQDDAEFSFKDAQGKVVVVSFMFTRCPDVCPLLTAKLAGIQNKLPQSFGRDVFFISVTVDPENDTPEVLRRYAEALGYDPKGWVFLTGTAEQITQTVRQYGIFHEKRSNGNVDHNLLTSIVDRNGILRVQYMGDRFDPDEFLHDLHALMNEDSE